MKISYEDRLQRLRAISAAVNFDKKKDVVGSKTISELVNILPREQFCVHLLKAMVSLSCYSQPITEDIIKKKMNR